jgi:hypothetical protein
LAIDRNGSVLAEIRRGIVDAPIRIWIFLAQRSDLSKSGFNIVHFAYCGFPPFDFRFGAGKEMRKAGHLVHREENEIGVVL